MTDDLWQKLQEGHQDKCDGKCPECVAEREAWEQAQEEDSIFHYINR